MSPPVGLAMRHLILLLLPLCVPGLAGAAPYPALADQPRLTLPISLYAEDLGRWSPERVDQAMTLADSYLDRCGMDLTWNSVLPLHPGDARRPDRLWRTDRSEEIVLMLRAPGDRRRYRMAGLVDLRRVRGRWVGEGKWSDLTLAVAQTIGRGALPAWPRPTGPDAGESIAKARLALMWAAAKGWITLDPAVSEGHCAFLRKRFMKLAKRPARRARPQTARGGDLTGAPVRVPGPPSALLVADVANRDAISAAIRVGGAWHMLDRFPVGLRQHPHPLPAHGIGRALLRVGGASLLLSEGPQGVHAAWWHPQKGRRGDFRADRWLKGCARVLAADVLRPPGDADDGDPGSAVVVCPERVFQLTPLPDQAERADPMPTSTWATLTRWGPGRSRLITGHAAQAQVWDLLFRAPPRRTADARVTALGAARPEAPIWSAPGAEPIQLASDALHGLAGGARPLGAESQVALFNPNLYRAARVGPAKNGRRAVRVDALYERLPRAGSVHADALWAAHTGDYGPLLWVLDRDGKRWRLKAPAADPEALARIEQRRLRRAQALERTRLRRARTVKRRPANRGQTPAR